MGAMPFSETPTSVLDFWFSDRVSKYWFASTPDFDRELQTRFEPLLKQAVRGDLNHWLETPEGSLALAIMLDQFPLNMYRGKAESYGTGDLAIATAQAAIARGFDQALPRTQVAFLYLPFMHSESLSDQDRSIELFEKARLEQNLHFARHHRELIRKFGRFPHRNAVLGRVNTPEEQAYLSSNEAFLG